MNRDTTPICRIHYSNNTHSPILVSIKVISEICHSSLFRPYYIQFNKFAYSYVSLFNIAFGMNCSFIY